MGLRGIDKPRCHPEARVLGGPKDLRSLLAAAMLSAKLHRSFVGSRQLSRTTPLPQDDNPIMNERRLCGKCRKQQVPHRAVARFGMTKSGGLTAESQKLRAESKELKSYFLYCVGCGPFSRVSRSQIQPSRV